MTTTVIMQVHTRHGPTIHAGKVVMATFMPLVANLAVVSRQVCLLPVLVHNCLSAHQSAVP
jgi:hypothetical protein